MIKVNHLSKKYGNHYAIKDLSFEIEEGKVYGFLGPNGAGKSTTMNIMTGYIAPSEGQVEICGFDVVKEAEEAKKNVGYLPEIPPLYQDMTVKEYLVFVAELKQIKKSERKNKVEEVMSKTFITDMQNRLIKNLSKGYKQRVGLAQAMLGEPKVIILDEPTVGLDPKQIIEIRDLIRNLKQKHTVILSSHILSEISEVCDELMIIAKGRMIAAGTVNEIMGQLNAGDKLDINCKATEKSVVEILNSINGVSDIVVTSTLEDGVINVTLNYNGEESTKDEVYQKLVDNQIQVYMFKNHSESLEDAFLELTSDENVEKKVAELDKDTATADDKEEKSDEDSKQDDNNLESNDDEASKNNDEKNLKEEE